MLPPDIFLQATPGRFARLALETFRHQAAHNSVYREYIGLLGVDPRRVSRPAQIPFLPIAFFRTHRVATGQFAPEAIFASSGTTSAHTSRHHVASLRLYEQSFSKCFERFYGAPSRYRILALLPSYQERPGSSLVHMAQGLIGLSGHPESQCFRTASPEVADTLMALEARGHPTILLGVTFALLELARSHRLALRHTVVMETGGMKGRGPELTREEVHSTLRQAFGVEAVHSEYGMTELLSQAYSQGEGLFRCPPWMAIRIRDPYDPLAPLPHGRTGGINIIDLANQHSCAFIQTDDLGVAHPNGTFRVLGRLEGSITKGCNLLAQP